MNHGYKSSLPARSRTALSEPATLPAEVSISQLTSSRLILTHPGSRCRTLLLAALVKDPTWKLYYYDLGAEDVSLSQFLYGLTYALARQTLSFGVRTREALAAGKVELAVLVEAFAQDLAQLSAEEFLLILDEVDRADSVADIQTFLANLLDILPAQGHLLISSRTLPRLAWQRLVTARQAVVLRDIGMLPDRFYTDRPDERPALEAHALGPGHAFVNGYPVKAWQGSIQRMMLFFALDRLKFTREEVCQAIWPGMPTPQVVNSFHVTKRRLHSAFGFDVLVFDGLHYQLNPSLRLHYDVLEFVTSLVEARSASGDEAARHWQRAIELYRGPYLQGYCEGWIAARREDFRAGYVEALQGLASICQSQGQDEAALGLFLRALVEVYEREDLHREVMRLYGRLGRREEAIIHYTRLVNHLKEQYGREPSAETQAIYRDISAGLNSARHINHTRRARLDTPVVRALKMSQWGK